MALTLTVTDQGDGTVQVTASGTGATATVYYATAGAAWAALGAAVSVGVAATRTLASGHYFFYAINNLSELSAVTTRTKVIDLTTEPQSLHYQLLLATQARFQDVLLDDIADTSILVLKVPDLKALEKDRSAAIRMPGILICQGKSEKIAGGTNNRDDVSYPVAVYIFAKDEKEISTSHNKYLRWREQLIHSVIHQRLDDVPEQFMADIEPGPIIHDGSWMAGLLASAFTIRYTARRSRGLI